MDHPEPQLDPERALDRALAGAVFPLPRMHLVWVARENAAPPALVSRIEGLPDQLYGSLTEVREALAEALAAEP